MQMQGESVAHSQLDNRVRGYEDNGRYTEEAPEIGQIAMPCWPAPHRGPRELQ
jgi:hypothetical protein